MDGGVGNKPRCHKGHHAVWVPAFAGTTMRREPWLTHPAEESSYASPTVSNIAASMACAVVLPAHTTNWNAGK